jgi:hypothetical protein
VRQGKARRDVTCLVWVAVAMRREGAAKERRAMKLRAWQESLLQGARLYDGVVASIWTSPSRAGGEGEGQGGRASG